MDEKTILALLADDEAEFAVISVAQNIVLELSSELYVPPRKIKRKRVENYLEKTVPQYSSSLYKEHFRMSPQTMEELVRVIGRNLLSTSTLRVELRKKVMFTMWILAKQESFLAVGDRFGYAKSTGYYAFREVVKELVKLIPTYIKWSDANKMKRDTRIFQRRSRGFPGVVGAIDGCHIQIKAPVGNQIDYYNRNKIHSIILQGTCDYKERFIDIFVGMPGRMHDARVFRQSELGTRLEDESNLIPSNYHLLGDSAYPLMRNLMTPFRDNGRLTARQINYNVKLSSIRSVIERAFGHLKGKFRRLRNLDVSSPILGNQIIGACCVLHNFLIDRNELHFEDECVEEDEVEENDVEDNEVDSNESRKRNQIVNILSIN